MTDIEMVKRKVIRITRSPLNARRWCCDLDCGHEVWVTGNRRPTSETLSCPECAAKMGESE